MPLRNELSYGQTTHAHRGTPSTRETKNTYKQNYNDNESSVDPYVKIRKTTWPSVVVEYELVTSLLNPFLSYPP